MSENTKQKKEQNTISVDYLVNKMRMLEIDHDPEGWPAVQMKDISTLCKTIENAIPSIDLLQTRLESGQYLSKQDNEWWLFEEDGSGICGGKNIRDILIHLIWIDR